VFRKKRTRIALLGRAIFILLALRRQEWRHKSSMLVTGQSSDVLVRRCRVKGELPLILEFIQYVRRRRRLSAPWSMRTFPLVSDWYCVSTLVSRNKPHTSDSAGCRSNLPGRLSLRIMRLIAACCVCRTCWATPLSAVLRNDVSVSVYWNGKSTTGRLESTISRAVAQRRPSWIRSVDATD